MPVYVPALKPVPNYTAWWQYYTVLYNTTVLYYSSVKILKSGLICQAYVGLLCEAIRLHAAHSEIPVTVPVIYRAFSNHTSSERRWEPVITAVYTEMLKQPMVFHSSPDVSEWIEAKNAIFNNLDQVLEFIIIKHRRVNSFDIVIMILFSSVIALLSGTYFGHWLL